MEPLPVFDLKKPRTVDETRALLAEHPDARLLGGGTDLIVNLRRGIERPGTVIDLNGIAELRTIEHNADGLRIGTAVTLAELTRDRDIGETWPVVAAAAAEVAGPTHREVATVGGNLCLDTRCVYYNQSEWWRRANAYCLKKDGEVCHVALKSKICFACYSGDLAPACLVLDATVDVAGPGGPRTMDLADLYREDGADHLCLEEGEFVVALNLPNPPEGLRAAYRKIRARGSVDFPLAGVAVALRRNGEGLDLLRVALTGTNSRPLRVADLDPYVGRAVDDTMLEQLERTVGKQMQPMSSTFTPQSYRRRAALNVTRRLIGSLCAEP